MSFTNDDRLFFSRALGVIIGLQIMTLMLYAVPYIVLALP